MPRLIIVATSIILLMTLGCASIPIGPSVTALTGSGLSMEQFSKDNIHCQQFASHQVIGTPNQVVTKGITRTLANDPQLRYDIAYIQCMYAKGHQVPIYGQFTGITPAQVTSAYPPIPSLAPKLAPRQLNHYGLTPTQND